MKTLEDVVNAIDDCEIPNVSDGDVLAMVLRNHEPLEHWAIGSDGETKLVEVACEQCANEWPCPTIKAARLAQAEGATEARS